MSCSQTQSLGLPLDRQCCATGPHAGVGWAGCGRCTRKEREKMDGSMVGFGPSSCRRKGNLFYVNPFIICKVL
jgi:hypothetical protein